MNGEWKIKRRNNFRKQLVKKKIENKRDGWRATNERALPTEDIFV
jgi:hypothetical protein